MKVEMDYFTGLDVLPISPHFIDSSSCQFLRLQSNAYKLHIVYVCHWCEWMRKTTSSCSTPQPLAHTAFVYHLYSTAPHTLVKQQQGKSPHFTCVHINHRCYQHVPCERQSWLISDDSGSATDKWIFDW